MQLDQAVAMRAEAALSAFAGLGNERQAAGRGRPIAKMSAYAEQIEVGRYLACDCPLCTVPSGRARLAAYQRHPWVLQVAMTAPPTGRNHLAWLECALRCLAGTPLTEQQKLSTTLLITGHVQIQASLLTQLPAPAPTEPATPGYGQTVTNPIDIVAFPAPHQAIATGPLD